jgi:hypothetical protein
MFRCPLTCPYTIFKGAQPEQLNKDKDKDKDVYFFLSIIHVYNGEIHGKLD